MAHARPRSLGTLFSGRDAPARTSLQQGKGAEMEHAPARDSVLRRELGSLPLRSVVRVRAGSSLREVAATLLREGVSCALVGDSNHELVTERDLTRAIATGRGPNDPVESVVVRMPVWATTTSEVADAAAMMLEHGVRHLVVLRIDGTVAGVVSMRQIFAIFEGLAHAAPGASGG